MSNYYSQYQMASNAPHRGGLLSALTANADAAAESRIAANRAARAEAAGSQAGSASLQNYSRGASDHLYDEATRQQARSDSASGQLETMEGWRQADHERALQAGASDQRQYEAETKRYVSDNDLRAQAGWANAINGMGGGGSSGGGLASSGSPGMQLYGASGQRIGGTPFSSSLLRK
jgi:hypothetical protein